MVADRLDDNSRGDLLPTGRRKYLRLAGGAVVGGAVLGWARNAFVTLDAPTGEGGREAVRPGATGGAAVGERPETAAREPATATDVPGASGSGRVRGAVYLPSRAFNGYQVWASYDPAERRRDLGYARRLNLNALRTFASYEYWRESPAAFERRFDDFLDAAGDAGIGVLAVLFESIGDRPTTENLTNTDIQTSFAVHSPDRRVIRDPSRWGGPRAFVEWFAGRYGGREELLALEVMNEPGKWERRVAFCREMLRAARAAHETVPLTIGCRKLAFNRQYADPPLDVYQFHHNIPPSREDMRAVLTEAERVSAETGTPVWLTEWQRTREGPPDRMLPDYSSLAPVVRESGVDGDFLWQLMLQPAYMERPRRAGRLNGVFHEDGTPYSAADARGIAGTDAAFAAERRSWPDWSYDISGRYPDGHVPG